MMEVAIRKWLLKQLNTSDPLDGVAVTVKLAVLDKGRKKVAKELRHMADCLDKTGSIRSGRLSKSA